MFETSCGDTYTIICLICGSLSLEVWEVAVGLFGQDRFAITPHRLSIIKDASFSPAHESRRPAMPQQASRPTRACHSTCTPTTASGSHCSQRCDSSCHYMMGILTAQYTPLSYLTTDPLARDAASTAPQCGPGHYQGAGASLLRHPLSSTCCLDLTAYTSRFLPQLLM